MISFVFLVATCRPRVPRQALRHPLRHHLLRTLHLHAAHASVELLEHDHHEDLRNHVSGRGAEKPLARWLKIVNHLREKERDREMRDR